MFTHCGGKGRLPVVIKSLKELEVPIAVVVDFDVLSNEHPLRKIVEDAGGAWAAVSADWAEVKAAVDAKKPELSTEEIKNEITGILQDTNSSVFPTSAKQAIQQVLRRSSPWSTAKSVGTTFVPNGQPSQACTRLLNALRGLGIFVVPVGELEGFVKTVGGHGPSWVNEALRLDIKSAPELEDARKFVSIFARS